MLPLALALLLAPGCSPADLYGLPVEEVRRRLGEGDREFLLAVAFDDAQARAAFRLGPGGPYYLALVCQEMGWNEAAETLLRVQLRHGDGSYRYDALVSLLAKLVERESYEEALAVGDDYLEDRPNRADGADESEYLRAAELFVEAHYWARRDEDTLALLDRFFAGSGADSAARSRQDTSAELKLFRAVTAATIDRSDWVALMGELALGFPASPVHHRAYGFLEQNGLLEGLHPSVRGVLQARALYSDGQYEPAARLLLEVVPAAPASTGQRSVLALELGQASLAAELGTEGAASLDRLADLLSDQRDAEAAMAAREMAGRLYRVAGAPGPAMERLRAVVLARPVGPDRDRALWYLLDVALRISPERCLEELEAYRAAWRRAGYFDRLIERLTTELVARGDSEGLRELYNLLRDEPTAIAWRLYYLQRRAGTQAQPPGAGVPYRSVQEDYYRLLLREIGAPVGPMEEERSGEQRSAQEPAAQEPAAEAPAAEGVLAGVPLTEPPVAPILPHEKRIDEYLDYGLLDLATQQVRSDGAGSRLRRRLASALIAARRYRTAISVIGSGYPWDGSLEMTRLAYPQAFDGLISRMAIEEDLPRVVVYGLVREESAFDADVVSSAGAVGLTQLMPSTAADEARRLRLSDYDLTAPEDNLRIGLHHFARLLGRLESVPEALMAYNAGLSRVRSWQRRFPVLPPDLMVEAIPFHETRHYVRKVMVTAAVYGRLYEDRPAEETVALFYPALD
jgi:soluble lytic murein transglycosylase